MKIHIATPEDTVLINLTKYILKPDEKIKKDIHNNICLTSKQKYCLFDNNFIINLTQSTIEEDKNLFLQWYQLYIDMKNIITDQQLSNKEITLLANRIPYLLNNIPQKRPYLFIHIAKTGGTSLGKMFEAKFVCYVIFFFIKFDIHIYD